MKKETEIKMKAKKYDLLWVFLIALIPRIICIALFSSPMRTPMDELGTLSTGAYFGGKDWTALTTFAKYYYGGGFTILFAPLFYLTNNVTVIYGTVLSVCAILQSISAPISYYIMKKYLKVDKRAYLFIGSIACSFMVVTRAMEVFNEHIVIGCVWIITLFACKLIEYGNNKKKKIIYTVGIMFLITYLLTTHARTKVILIAFCIVVVCYLIFYRKWLVEPISGIISLGVFYFAAGKFNTMVKKTIWNWQEGKFLRNTKAKMDITPQKLANPKTWNAVGSTIFGQINTVLVFSGGIFALILIMLIFRYKDTIAQLIVTKKALAVKDEEGNFNAEPFCLVISALFIMCIGAVMLAQCFTWLKRVVPALDGGNPYGFKALTYVRYVGPFLGPVFMTGIAMIYEKRESIRKYLVGFAILLLSFQTVWVCFILPKLGTIKVSSEVYNAFSGYDIGSGNPMRTRYYLMATVIIVMLLVVFLICYYKKKIMIPLIILTILFGYEYIYGAAVWDGYYCDRAYEYSNGGTEVIRELEDKGFDVPKDIYVVDDYDRSGVQRNTYAYQLILNEYTIYAKQPEDLTKDNIVFSTISNYQELLDAGYKKAQLDNNEYVYVKGNSYIKMFESVSVKFGE